MIWLIVGLIVLAAFLLLMRWLAQAEPQRIKKALKSLAFVAGGGFLVLLFWRWRVFFLPLMGLLRHRSRQQKGHQTVRTDTLEMWSQNGRIEGSVLTGTWAGQSLSSLSLSDLRALFATCQTHDQRSAMILETYLNQRFGRQWHPDAHRQTPAAGERSEAFQILGLDPRASKDEIIAAHRRLIRKLHPDRNNGNDQSAAQINRARDILLGRG